MSDDGEDPVPLETEAFSAVCPENAPINLYNLSVSHKDELENAKFGKGPNS